MAAKTSTPPTGTYSYAQLEQLWINAGGSKALAPIMAAIAEAESGGNPTAYNASGATGLWQILGAVDPADQPNLTTPTVNAHEAVLKYNSQGLDAWVTYTSGAYKAFLSNSTTPDPNVPTGGATLDSSNSGGGNDVVGACILSMPSVDLYVTSVGGGCILSKSNVRALLGGLLLGAGGILALAGVAVLVAAGFAQTGAGRAVSGAVSAVPGTGRVVGAITR